MQSQMKISSSRSSLRLRWWPGNCKDPDRWQSSKKRIPSMPTPKAAEEPPGDPELATEVQQPSAIRWFAANGSAYAPPAIVPPPYPPVPPLAAAPDNDTGGAAPLFDEADETMDGSPTEVAVAQAAGSATPLLPDAPLPSVSTGGREPQWTLPAAADDVSVQEGFYRGRSQVGDPGAMLRVSPSVRSRLSGAYIPDSTVDSGIVSDSVSVGVVSIKGASHHLSGTPRQDAYAIGSDDSWVVIAVADGVSEGKLSHVAATEAARVTVTESIRALAASTPDLVHWPDVGRKAKDAVRALGQRRAQQQVGPADSAPEISDRTIAQIMSTTCDLLVVPTSRKDGSLRVWRVRISGDGSFYVLDPARGWGLLDAGKDSASSTVDNSVADPLPLGGDSPDVESWELAPGQAIVLCTDGFGDVIAEGARPVGRYLFDAWQHPLDTTQLLFTSSFVNTNADDDRTAAIVWATA